MGTQINKGTTFVDGQSVNATNLNNHVDDATLSVGAITAQTAASSVNLTDNLLLAQGSSLAKGTVSQVKTVLGVDSKLSNTGAQTLNGSLNIGTSSQVSLTTSGIALLTTNQILTLSQNPVLALQAAPKQYVDSSIDAAAGLGRIICKGYFSNTTSLTPPSSADTSKYLTVNATRASGSTTLVVDISGLASKYKSLVTPFFLVNQFVGINSTTGITGRLHQIIGTTSSTFSVSTTESTSFSGQIQLTCVYDNSSNDDTSTYNCKSIYLCVASNKIYVNYWRDKSGSYTNINPARYLNSIVSGQAVSNGGYMNAIECASVTNLNNYSQNVPYGFGSVETGIHLGMFAAQQSGSPYPYFYRASFSIS